MATSKMVLASFGILTLVLVALGARAQTAICQNENGEDYSGSVNHTISSFTCKKWSSITTALYNSYTTQLYSSVGDHNYCRNPDGERGVWCLSTNPDKEWELCDVPVCAQGLKVCYVDDELLCADCRGAACVPKNSSDCPGVACAEKTANDEPCNPRVWLCDGVSDCADGSDELEKNCGNCLANEFTCADGKQCIPESGKCNSVTDCRDRSDESPSLCNWCASSNFACATTSQCVWRFGLCDGLLDCSDGSDELEKNCGNCLANEFACTNGKQCIPDSWKCNGVEDCLDGSDEEPIICGDEHIFLK